MDEEGARSPGLIRAAETMEGRFGEIFADYERRLEEMGSLLVVGEGNPREQLEKNARDVLERAVKVLRGQERSLLAVEEEIFRNIEDSQEPLNPHPDESFRAGVAVKISPKEVTALVWDHGPGFENSEAVTEGLGLKSMQERAELLDGSFEVTSEPDRGTVVKVRLPLMPRESGAE